MRGPTTMCRCGEIREAVQGRIRERTGRASVLYEDINLEISL